MKHSKTKAATLISSTFSFLLTLLFFLLFVCMGLSFGVFNNKSIISKINETNYYDKLYVELNKKAEEIVLQAGLPTTVLKDVITLERVYVGGNNYVNNTLKGNEQAINTNNLQNSLIEHIDQYFEEQNIEQTKEVKSGIDGVVSRIEQEYSDGIELKFVTYFMDSKKTFCNAMKFSYPILIILIASISLLLLKIHKHKHRGLRYINYAMISSSFLILLIAMILLLNKGYEKINVMPIYYRDFLEAYLKWDISTFLIIGGVELILSIALVSLTLFLKKRLQNS